MKVLFLDDDLERHKRFKTRIVDAGHKVQYVFDAAEAINALEQNPAFDEVWLDHDLNDMHYIHYHAGTIPTDEQTGYTVACYIAEALPEDKRPKCVVVHSMNPSGADRMTAALKSAGIPVRRQFV